MAGSAAQPIPDRVAAYTATTGTGAVTLGSALPGLQLPPAEATGFAVPYVLQDGTAWETGVAVITYSGGTWTATRVLRKSSTGSLLALSGGAQWFVDVGGVDIAYAADVTAHDARIFANEREIMVLELLRSVSAVALNAVGFLDDYADLSGIDTANSTNFSLAAAGDLTNLITVNGAIESSSSIPAFTSGRTSATNSAGYTLTASSTYDSSGSFDVWQAMDYSTGTEWAALGKTGSLTLYAAGTSLSIGKYTVTAANEAVTINSLQGSNDGSTWTALDTPSATISGGGVYTKTFSAPASYKYFRLNLTGSSNAQITEWNLFKQSTSTAPAALSVRSIRATLQYVPQRVFLYAPIKLGGGALNTNVTGKVTRDGSTYTAGTWAALFTRSDGFSICELRGADGKPGVDVTGQPSGQTIGYQHITDAAYRYDYAAADCRGA